ncbi:HD-GYP domain-containing protein [Bacillus sp. T33-2]|uniref:HD-GYP domain-containing protein n=1 Tax=Bacillus sp. T33-2 TaxID=2054168 RepID=UPI000C770A9E|nr:HD-GYP domain-containing protein [Bacillus sp. T33-2]PLR99679.1 phosphohydrolase [Bacillus sp. T33-2]
MSQTTPPKERNITSLSLEEVDVLLNNKRDAAVQSAPSGSNRRNVQIKSAAKMLDEAACKMEEIFEYIVRTGIVPVADIIEKIQPAITAAVEIPHIYHLFYELKSKDEYTFRHAVCVGVIASLIGKWAGLSEKELNVLAVGATLHDIGKARISKDILNKPGKLTEEEYAEMKRHTVYGYQLLKDLPGLKEAALIALQHHEREDGGGYPFGLTGDKISRMAKIVAIADVFHAMSSSRVYHKAEPLHIVINQMQDDVYGKFDPHIMILFLYKMMNSIVGHRVLLSDGREGTIVMIDSYEPLLALVRIGDELVDLRHNRSLQIAQVLKDG